MRKTFATIVVAFLVGLGLTLAASPASAHTYTSTQGSDYATVTHGYTCPTNGTPCYYRKIVTTDKECDGNRVSAFYHLNGGSATYTQDDINGCDPGGYGIVYDGGTISSFRVCEATSSGWVCGPLVSPQSHITV